MREMLDMENRAGEAQALLDHPLFQEMCYRLEAQAIEQAIRERSLGHDPNMALTRVLVIRELKAGLESVMADPGLARLTNRMRNVRSKI
jgi:hypothetical protein